MAMATIAYPYNIDYLQKLKIQDVVDFKKQQQQRGPSSGATGGVISIEGNKTAREALELLHKYNVLSVPVFRYADVQENGQTKRKKEFYAVLGIIDLLFLCAFQDEIETTTVIGPSMDAAHVKFLQKSVDDLVGRNWESTRLIHFSTNDRFLDLLFLLSHGLHRALIVTTAKSKASQATDEGKQELLKQQQQEGVTNIYQRLELLRSKLPSPSLIVDEQEEQGLVFVSQMDVLNFLWSKRSEGLDSQTLFENTSAEMVEQSAWDLRYADPAQPVHGLIPKATASVSEGAPTRSKGFATSYAIRIPKDIPAVLAFRTMYIHRVPAAAIIDKLELASGKIIANLSASDLRGMPLDHLNILGKSVIEFLGELYGSLDKIPEAKCVGRKTSLAECTNLLLKNNIHRLWMIEGEGKPVGVVSLSDILRQFLPQSAF